MNPNPETVIFTYGNTIYVPSGRPLPDHLVEHEQQHIFQQAEYQGGKDAWWDRYLEDQLFRITVETKAYGRQYAFICAKVKDRNMRFQFLNKLATDLSGPMYGNVIGHVAAMNMIRDKSGQK